MYTRLGSQRLGRACLEFQKYRSPYTGPVVDRQKADAGSVGEFHVCLGLNFSTWVPGNAMVKGSRFDDCMPRKAPEVELAIPVCSRLWN